MDTIVKCELCSYGIPAPTQVVSNGVGYIPAKFMQEDDVCQYCMCATATFAEFQAHWTQTVGRQEHQRPGQWAFNMLQTWRPDISAMMVLTLSDPFHNEKRLPAFWEYVEKNW